VIVFLLRFPQTETTEYRHLRCCLFSSSSFWCAPNCECSAQIEVLMKQKDVLKVDSLILFFFAVFDFLVFLICHSAHRMP